MKTIVTYHLFLICIILPTLCNAQLIVLTGNIINEKSENSLENVNILESFSGIGTISNLSGYFSLILNPGKIELTITHDGFKDYVQKMDLKTDTTITVSLVPVLNLKAKNKDSEHQKIAQKLNKKEN